MVSRARSRKVKDSLSKIEGEDTLAELRQEFRKKQRGKGKARKKLIKMESEDALEELREDLVAEDTVSIEKDVELDELREKFGGIEHQIESERTCMEKGAGVGRYDAARFGPIVAFEGIEGFREIERYWIERPFSFALILFNEKTGEHLYHLVEPPLTDVEKNVLERAREDLKDRLSYEEAKNKEGALMKEFAEIIGEYGISDPKSTHKILYHLRRDTLGYEKLDPLLKDKEIEDISCNGADIPVYLYHRKHFNIRTNLTFGKEELDSLVIRLVERCGKHISYASPVVEATLPDGSRLQAALGTEVTTKGTSFTIRKFMGSTFTPVDLIRYGTFNPEMLAHLWLATENHKNIMITGGTATGKTSTLNALAFFIPPDAKIVSIEDTRELSLYQENWLPNVTRESGSGKKFDMYELVRGAMRQRPECIIVGEVRGREALALFQAMATGHTTYCTIHAGSVQDVANRLEGEPINLPRQMLAELDMICVQDLTYKGKRRIRRNRRVVEFAGLDPASGGVRVVETYTWDPTTDSFRKSEESHVMREIMRERGWNSFDLMRELENRERVLRYLVENNITSYGEIASIIRRYYFDATEVLKKISSGQKGA